MSIESLWSTLREKLFSLQTQNQKAFLDQERGAWDPDGEQRYFASDPYTRDRSYVSSEEEALLWEWMSSLHSPMDCERCADRFLAAIDPLS